MESDGTEDDEEDSHVDGDDSRSFQPSGKELNTLKLTVLWHKSSGFMINVTHVDDDASTSQLPESSSLTQHTGETSHEEASLSHAVDDELGKVTQYVTLVECNSSVYITIHKWTIECTVIIVSFL